MLERDQSVASRASRRSRRAPLPRPPSAETAWQSASLAAGGCGVLHETETAQEALAKLQSLSGEIGAVELRLVAPPAGLVPIPSVSCRDEICSAGGATALAASRRRRTRTRA